ncbi:tyrosine-type recombinase/integrase [Devosia submarina]|uniref:tyrosine-type recombinase/integrase n=1 Tax=Devosia submarina TaxID=1173082 RepID=UPI001472C27E|nr:tyrosine-type recombinase/integrase [Devosia submarina]
MPRFVVEYEVPKGSGKWFVYFRQKGQKNVRMHGTPGTPEWEELYRRLLAGFRPEAKKLHQPNENTFAWLCQQYMSSPEYGELNERTRRVRRGILNHCMGESPKGQTLTYGEVPLDEFKPTTVARLRDAKRGTPEAANGRVKAIRAVFNWATSTEVNITQINPARHVKYYRSNNPAGHHTWTIEEVEKFERRHPIGTKAHLALALLLYTGQRRGDIVQFGRKHEKSGWLKFTQQKNRDKKPIDLEIPIFPELKKVLDASPTGDEVYLVNEFNKPFSDNGFGNWFRDRCIEAGVPGRAHGLRKACATRLAEKGATPHEIMSITGHRTLKEVVRYTQAANQKQLAESASKR